MSSLWRWRYSWLVINLWLLVSTQGANATCFPAIFNFGDSASDTGGNHAAFPTETMAEFAPYGETYFHEPQWRYSDGRLIIDFLTEAYGIRFLDPYMESVTSDFSNGVNFAIAWSTSRRVLDYRTLFPLSTQVTQFQLFKKEVLEVLNSSSAVLTRRGLLDYTSSSTSETSPSKDGWTAPQHPFKKLYNQLYNNQKTVADNTTTQDPDLQRALEAARRLPLSEYFDQGLYMISTGTSDFEDGVAKSQTIAQMQAFLPDMVSSINSAVRAIYDGGARSIIVSGVGPLGCSPVQLTVLTYDITELDSFGCLTSFNTLVRSYNSLLKQNLTDLSLQFPDAQIIYLDIYQLQHNLLFNYTDNGLTQNIKSCCGVPSTYNFDATVQCGESGIVEGGLVLVSEMCPDPSEYTIWDGYHFTEAANKYFARQILSGRYFDPPFSLSPDNCPLNPL